MNELRPQSQNILDFWNFRAELGEMAGTKDLIAKKLEIDAISKYVNDGMRILDAGCGNGITAIEIACRYDVAVLGFDFAEEMINAALKMSKNVKLKGSVSFQIGDIKDCYDSLGKFDMVYTERTLINLPDWPAQKNAIFNLIKLLSDHGIFVMCENSQDGLDKINSLRESVGLNKIEPPWHNRYLRDFEIERCIVPGAMLEKIEHITSTYHFLSRVVNAWIASKEGKEPDYQSLVNQLALRLPAIGDFGQTRIWLWRKTAEGIKTIRNYPL